jgi:hypothetical protein
VGGRSRPSELEGGRRGGRSLRTVVCGSRVMTHRKKEDNEGRFSSSFVVWVPCRYRDVAPGVSIFLHLPFVVAVHHFVMSVRRPGRCRRCGMPR